MSKKVNAMSERMKVGVLGATGMVGQHFVKFLSGHPWFELSWLGASDRSAGKLYRDATTWRLGGVMPPEVRDLMVSNASRRMARRNSCSRRQTRRWRRLSAPPATAGHTVVSNSRNHRMDEDVPPLVTEINSDH